MSILRNATAKPTICEKATHLPKPTHSWGLFPFERKGDEQFILWLQVSGPSPTQCFSTGPCPSVRVRIDIVLCCTLHIDPDPAHFLIWWEDKCVAALALLSTEFGREPPGLWRRCKSPEKRNITLLKRLISQQKRMVMFIDINWINKQDNKSGIATEITWKCCILNFTYFYCLWNGLLFYVSSFWYTEFVWFHHVSWEKTEGKKLLPGLKCTDELNQNPRDKNEIILTQCDKMKWSSSWETMLVLVRWSASAVPPHNFPPDFLNTAS